MSARLPTPHPAALPLPLRIVCGFNAIVWLVATPPWSAPGALAAGSAAVGAALWAALAIGGNRTRIAQQLATGIGVGYLLSLVAVRVAG
ncbi:hypothetical protein [Arenimonas composti]|uniref:Uncharacterized protein n=1 Tax=Arenimonas composti TR7-09 = DSM 18010 TaxID=1121013 RepID=A0A091BBA1_9GAMM|nr:hypothetical protein [Arenimonas composti]KFN48986.1 hypothetical protein P873_12635 [Arenimonas composti TR7-09 = DSM 18010]